LDETLAVQAARRRVPLSTLVEELVERGLRPNPTPEEYSIDFPEDWDGADLRARLYYIRMRQTDLAAALAIPDQTLNHWIRGAHPFDKGVLPRIQQAMKNHKPGTIEKFRTGSRSPEF
jgi:hypothetical protein